MTGAGRRLRVGNGGGAIRAILLTDGVVKSLSDRCERRVCGKGGRLAREEGPAFEALLAGLGGISSCLDGLAERERERGEGLEGSPMRVFERVGCAMQGNWGVVIDRGRWWTSGRQ